MNNSEYLNCQEICESWGVKRIDVFNLIAEKGLRPFSTGTFLPLPCKYTTMKVLERTESTIELIERYSRDPYDVDESEELWAGSHVDEFGSMLKDAKAKRSRIMKEIKQIERSGNIIDDSWRHFSTEIPISTYKVEMDRLLESLFLESQVVSLLGPPVLELAAPKPDRETIIRKASREVLIPLVKHLRDSFEEWKGNSRKCHATAIDWHKRGFPKDHGLIRLAYLDDDTFTPGMKQHMPIVERYVVRRLLSRMLKCRTLPVGLDREKLYRHEKGIAEK